MPAYLIVLRNESVREPAEMEEYQRLTRLIAPTLPMAARVVYGAIHGLEGSAPDAVVMIEFQSMDDARTWYASPAYQAALPHRLKAADYTSFIVEGLGAPA